MIDKMDRTQLLQVSRSGAAMPGPAWRRIDNLVPDVGIECWGVLVEFGPRFTLEDLAQPLLEAGNPPMFKSEGEAIDWLVGVINDAPIASRLRDKLAAIKVEADAKDVIQKHEELARARKIIEDAEKRVRESEVT
jgi:hypothetical protein